MKKFHNNNNNNEKIEKKLWFKYVYALKSSLADFLHTHEKKHKTFFYFIKFSNYITILLWRSSEEERRERA
jgi:hypothetical protein